MKTNRLIVAALSAMLAGTTWGCGAAPSPAEAPPPASTLQRADTALPTTASEEAPSYEVLRRGGGRGGGRGGRMSGGGGRGHVTRPPSGGHRPDMGRPGGGTRPGLGRPGGSHRPGLGTPGGGNRPSWWGRGGWRGHGRRPAWWGSRTYVRNSYVIVGGYYYPYYESDTVGICYPDYSSPYMLVNGQYEPYYTSQPAYGADTVQCSTATIVHR